MFHFKFDLLPDTNKSESGKKKVALNNLWGFKSTTKHLN